MEAAVTFAGVEITARWDVDCWDLYHVPRPFRARVAKLLNAERDRQHSFDDGSPCDRRYWS